MTKRDDMIAALKGRQPKTAVPRWELGFHAWNVFSDLTVTFGEAFARQSSAEQEHTLHTNADIILSVADKLGFAAITVPAGYWHVAPGVLAYYILPGESRYRQIEVLQKKKPADLMLVAGSGGVMAMPAAEEYVDFCYKVYDSPDEIDQRAQRNLREGLDNARRLRDLGVETVYTASDVADNHGSFFKPELMERFVWRYLRQWAHSVREMGLYAILHSDGDLAPCLDIIANSGIHALQAIDLVAGMDIAVVKAQIGHKICLCGNVDCGLLVTGPVEDIREATRNILRHCMHNGGFVLGASNAVQMEVPKEHYLAMVDTWKHFGRYS